METEEPDAICVTETWFYENSCPSFNKYNLYIKDIVDFRHGEGSWKLQEIRKFENSGIRNLKQI